MKDAKTMGKNVQARIRRYVKPGSKLRKAGHDFTAIFLVLVLSVWQTPAVAFAANDDDAALEAPETTQSQVETPASAPAPASDKAEAGDDEPAVNDTPAPTAESSDDAAPADAGEAVSADKPAASAKDADDTAASPKDAASPGAASSKDDAAEAPEEDAANEDEALPQKWSIRFDANGGTLRADADDKPLELIEDSGAVKLPKKLYEREDYTFTGWNTVADPNAEGVDKKKALFVPEGAMLKNLAYRYVVLTKDNASKEELEGAIATPDGKKIALVAWGTSEEDAKAKDDKDRKIETCDLRDLVKDDTLTLYAQWKKDEKDKKGNADAKDADNADATANTAGTDNADADAVETADADNNDAAATDETPTDEPNDTATEGPDETTTPEEAPAAYSESNNLEAVDVQGPATKSKAAARQALASLPQLNAQEAAQAADQLFTAAAAPQQVDVPRQLDGSNIENISAKWITPDTVDNDDASLLYVKPSKDEDQSVRLQINYALSGEHNYEPGDITITVPAFIFKNRAGNNYGTMIIPFPEDPSRKGDFNWKLVGDNYILTNTKRMSAATKGYIQFAIGNMVPHQLVDMQESSEFDAYIEVVTHKGNTIALRSNALTAQFDTQAVVSNVAKRVYGSPQRVAASEIPESQRIDGESEYIKVNWYVWGVTEANTMYVLNQTDSIDGTKVVGAVAAPTDDNPKATKDITEAEAQGFIIGATTEDGRTLVKPKVYTGYEDGQTGYYYFSTAYPASQFLPDTTYTFHNSVEFEVVEVDPAATKTNPNVDNGTDENGNALGSADPQKVTRVSANAQTSWSYTDPKWYDPTGHFMVVKNGNDDKEQNGVAKRNYTHKKSYTGSYSDLHLWSWSPNGWYGIYPSAINDLQDQFEANGVDGGVRLSYTIDSVGYVMPWMFDSASYDTDHELAPRKSSNYTRPVQMVTTDTGVSIGRYAEKLKVGTDYEFVSVEFPDSPWLYTGTPQNINPDGSWAAVTAGDGTFKYVRDMDKTHWPAIELQIQQGDKWVHWATASWQSGSKVITLANGSTQADGVVNVPANTQNFRTRVTLQNASTDEQANLCLQAAIDYDVRPVIQLKSTQALMALIDAAFAKSNAPEMFVYNGVNMKAYDANEAEIVSIDKDGYDSIRGYTTDTMVYPSKSSKQSIADVDYDNRIIAIHYSAKVEERSVINDKKTWEQAIEDGRLVAETHGVWRDLLPKGVTPDVKSVKLRRGDTVTDVYTIENYQKTGRTMLVVEADLTPTAVQYRSGDLYYYEDVPSISFDAMYGFDSYIDYGDKLHNVISFESSNDVMGTVKDYAGEPDDARSSNNVATARAFDSNAERDAMTDLNPNRDTPSFVYAGTYTEIDLISAARTSLQKDVMVNNDGYWSTGLYYTDDKNTPEAPEGNRRTVYEGGQYSYRLRMMSDDATISKDLILYDSLEDFKAGDGNDPMDIDAPTWQGTFRGVDVSQMEAMGCAPVVYYHVGNIQLSDETDPEKGNATNMDLTNSSLWVKASEYTGDLAAVKGIAVDASKKADGSDFELQPMESVVLIVNMQAPSGDEARGLIDSSAATVHDQSAHAYNNAYLLCTSVDAESGEADGDNFVRKDYTKVGLMEYNYTITKVWDDDNNRDGLRPALDENTGTYPKVAYHLLRDGQETGDVAYLDAQGKAVFEHLPYTDPQGNKYRYSAREDAVEGYTATWEYDANSVVFTNTHAPELVQVSGQKLWQGDDGNEDARPESITVQLYKQVGPDATPSFVKSQTVKPDSNGAWNYSFDKLFKYENGTPITYTVREVASTGKAASYTQELNADGRTFVNTYHPYGDLLVSKAVEDTTSVSAETEFPFTFEFTRTVEGQDDPEPVSDDFSYEVLDANGQPVLDADGNPVGGTLTRDNRTVAIKGGQAIHVKDVPEYVNYKVKEAQQEGFTQSAVEGAEGTIAPNATKQASFINTYAAGGRINLAATKTLQNRELKRYQFKFELYQVDDQGNETLVSTASNARPNSPVLRQDETVESSTAEVMFRALSYTQADAQAQLAAGEDAGLEGPKPYTYVIREVVPEDAVNANGVVYADADAAQKAAGGFQKGGYTYDAREYTVQVTVVDNGDGTLDVTPVYGQMVKVDDLPFGVVSHEEFQELESADFQNVYEAKGDITLRAWKDLQGRTLKDGEFTFELLDEEGNPVLDANDKPATATNMADGSVVFSPENIPALNYNQEDIGKTYSYIIHEIAGLDDTVNYDDTPHAYGVTIYDNGDGTLSLAQNTQSVRILGGSGGIEWFHGKSLSILQLMATGVVQARPASIAIQNASGYRWGKLSDLESSEVNWEYAENKYGNNTRMYTWEIVSKYSDETDEEFFHRVEGIIDGFDQIGTLAEGDVYAGGKNGVAGLIRLTNDGDPKYVVDDDGELPVFTNTLKDGSLSITKLTQDAESADPNQEFNFKVKLIGEGVEDGTGSYTLSQVGTGLDDASKDNQSGQINAAASAEGIAQAVVSAFAPEKAFAAEVTTGGTAYAIIDNQGNMTFFRSSASYSGSSSRTISINGRSYTGVVYQVPEKENYSEFRKAIPWNSTSIRSSIKTVKVAEGHVIKPVSMYCWFWSCENLTSVDLTGFDTSECVSMSGLFMYCKNLRDLTGEELLDTSNVEKMSGVFQQCSSLPSVDVGGWDVSKVTTLFNAFRECKKITALDLSGWDIPTGVDMGWAFRDDVALKTLYTGRWKITSLQNAFYGCSGLEVLDVSRWDMSSCTGLFFAFYNCKALDTLDVGNWGITDNLSRIEYCFTNCEKLKGLDFGKWDMSGLTSSADFLSGCKSLARLELNALSDISASRLPNVPTAAPFDGTWIELKSGEVVKSADLMALSSTSEAGGSWVWNSGRATIVFEANGNATGAMPQQYIPVDHSANLDSNRFAMFGYEFAGWNTESEGTGESYSDGQEITPTEPGTITLYAQWIPVDTSYEMVNGEFDLTLHGNETATFNNLPAGTAYQVWEETPDGWVLVEQSNVSGTIEPLVTAQASFTNKYQPGVTTAQFAGTKTLDGKAAEAGAYSFTLSENGKVLQTKETQAGGFIQFDAIEYDNTMLGTHTYTIAEVNPNNSEIDYDTHKETVTVEVTDNGDGTLSSKTTYDADGISFANKTRPGNLKVTKAVENGTSANANDEFTFKITLNNPNGQPIGSGDEVYWYTEDASGKVVQKQQAAPKRAKAAESQVAEPQAASGDEEPAENSDAVEPAEEAADAGILASLAGLPAAIDNFITPKAYADTSDIASGTYEGITWRITSSGELIIGNGGVEYLRNSSSYRYTSNWPWQPYKASIKSVRFDGKVYGQGALCYMFNGFSNCTSMDFTGFDTSNAWTMGSMFNGCSSLVSLDLSGFDTRNISGTSAMNYLFFGCDSLRSLNIENFYTNDNLQMGSVFPYSGALSEIVVGAGFFHNANARLSVPPSKDGYSGKWVRADGTFGPYTVSEMREKFTEAMTGTWVWEIDQTKGLVQFDANGGYTSATQITATSAAQAITMPGGKTTRPHYILTGWNTKQDGSGASYEANETSSSVVKLGAITTLYAQWEATDLRDYKVRHYQQNTSLNGYNLATTETLHADKDTTVSPAVKSYAGFVSPEAKSAVVLDNDSLVIDYYYDRITYEVAFDGNGATSGQMNENQTMVGGISKALPANTFQKKGAIFNGWNTKADGSGTAYTDKATVRDLATENGEVVTLYAQWLSNEDNQLEPTNGVVYVKVKSGQTAVLPDLPAGTTYTIEEVDVPNGWKQTGVVNENGSIAANITSTSTVTNRYEAQGFAQIVAHKALEGEELSADQFSFQLLDSGKKVLETVTNSEGDTNRNVADEDGNQEENAWYGTALVGFSPLEYTQADIGKTFTYYIREVAGSDAGVNYDKHEETVKVAVSDAGSGVLETTVTYDADGALFSNSMKDSTLRISKTALGGTGDEDFTFTVDLKDANGNPLEGEYAVKTYTRDYVPSTKQTVTKYSHTQNISDAGVKQSDYGNNWTNSHIRGTDRTSSDTQAHVVSIPGASSLNVSITYGGESASYDWVCMWRGAQPSYTAQNNYGSSLTGKLGGGSYTAASNTKHYTVNGDTVTFAFRSDGSVVGDGYGYYAVITGDIGEPESGTKTATFASGDTITLKGGEYAEIAGLPHGATYTVTEADKANWNQTAADGDAGTLQASQASTAKFTNTYQTPPDEPYNAFGSAAITATKSMPGSAITEDDDFAFQLLDANGDVLQTRGVDSFGGETSSITFSDLAYSLEDAGQTYTYTLREVAGADEDITYDPTVYTVNVAVGADDGSGVLPTTVTYGTYNANDDFAEAADGAVFTNVRAQPVSISGTKVWDDAENANGTRPESVTVNLLANGRTVQSAQVEANGQGDWNFTFDNLPRYSNGEEIAYTVEEAPVDGYSATYGGDAETGFTITNRPAPTLQFAKYLFGADGDISDMSFNFTLVKTDASGKPLENSLLAPNAAYTSTVQNAKFKGDTASVTFQLPALPAGDHYYTVAEDESGYSDIAADTMSYLVHVVVDESGLASSIDYYLVDEDGVAATSPDPAPAFYNNTTGEVLLFASAAMSGYDGANGRISVYPQVQKYVDGSTAPLVGGDYLFTLSGEGVSTTQANDVAGNVAFYDEDDTMGLVFDQPGTYVYTINEQVPANAVDNGDGTATADGVIYDASAITMTVEVSADDNGVLSADVSYAGMLRGTAPAFYNATEGATPAPENTQVSLTVDKFQAGTHSYLEGAELEVVDASGNVVDSWTTTSAQHVVSGLVPGASYTLSETAAPDGYQVVDDTEFTVSADGTGVALTAKDSSTQLAQALRIALYDPAEPVEEETIVYKDGQNPNTPNTTTNTGKGKDKDKGTTPGVTNKDGVKTGDTAPVAPLLALAACGLAAALYAVWRRRALQDPPRGAHARK